jgi:CheY-like chemotaxis protein
MKTLLLAEDDPHISLLVGYALERLGCRIESLADGRDVLSRLSRAPLPDVVVLDVNLPGLNGFEILRAIKEREDLRPIPVLMLSAASHESSREQARRLGAIGFIEKPFDVAKLAAIVEGAMSAGRA